MQFARINDISLHYRQDGQPDGLPLVFINSLGTDMRIWDDVVPHFADQYRIVRHDKRGHGLSDCPAAPYSISDHSDDVAGLLDYLGIESAVMVGISVGGMIALDFASRQPERVQAMVVCDTLPKIGTAEMWNERIRKLRQDGMDSMAEVIPLRWFAPSFPTAQPAAYRGYQHMFTRMPVEGYCGTCTALRDADLTAQTRGIHTPTLVVGGAEDASTPPELVRGLADTLPDSQFQLIEGAGHLPCVEQPERFAGALMQFLKENAYA